MEKRFLKDEENESSDDSDKEMTTMMIEKSDGDSDSENDDSGSEDSAPDDVSFASSKADSLKIAKLVQQNVKEQKERGKDKRKERQAQFVEQKRRKVEQLQAKKLPDELLQAVSRLEEATKKPPQDKETSRKSSSTGVTHDPQEKHEKVTSEDYIPLNSESDASTYKVIPLDALKRSQTTSKSAAEFRKNMIYGKRIRRMPNSKVKSYQQKQSASGGNRFA